MKQWAPEHFVRLMKFYEASQAPSPFSFKLRHLLWVAVDAVPSHLYAPGIELHARLAIEHGATVAEVFEALEIASTSCERSFTHALPVVIEVARAAGVAVPDTKRALTAEQEAVRAAFVAREGTWPSSLDLALHLLPDYLGAQLHMNHAAPALGGLDARSRALIFLAVYACPAMLDLEAVRHHARCCIDHGATTEELIEALKCASGIGIHAFSMGAPAVTNALRASS
jgi:alkylhydroperoxidase/carboxymuconolactone decarboxylase family protein YurZ